MEKKKHTRPVHEITLPFGGALLKAAIWKHDGKNGPRFSVSLSRVYREKEDGKWKSTGYFYKDDLLGVSRLSEVCNGWLVNQIAKGGAKKC
jgi:hypothetical protein